MKSDPVTGGALKRIQKWEGKAKSPGLPGYLLYRNNGYFATGLRTGKEFGFRRETGESQSLRELYRPAAELFSGHKHRSL